MLLLNCSAPLSADETAAIGVLVSYPIDRTIALGDRLDLTGPVPAHLGALLDACGLSPDEWRTVPVFVVVPTDPVTAAAILVELHARMSRPPDGVLARPAPGVTDVAGLRTAVPPDTPAPGGRVASKTERSLTAVVTGVDRTRTAVRAGGVRVRDLRLAASAALRHALRSGRILGAGVVALDLALLAASLWLLGHPEARPLLDVRSPSDRVIVDRVSHTERPSAVVRADDGDEISADTSVGDGDAVVLTFPSPVTVDVLLVQADGNDTYALRYRQGNSSYETLPDVTAVPGFGLRTRRVSLDRAVVLTELEVAPVDGDGMWGVASVRVGQRSRWRFLAVLALALATGAALGRTAWRARARLTARPAAAVALAFLGVAFGCVAVTADAYRSLPASIHPSWYRPMWVGLGALLLGVLVLHLGARRRAVRAGGTAGGLHTQVARPGAGLREWAGSPAAGLRAHLARPERGDVAWWLVVLALIVVFRLSYLVTGHVPAGLFFEEHEAAYGGREFLYGKVTSLAQMYNFTAIALAFRTLGISEVSLRAAASTMGALGAVLFALTARRLFSRRVALVCTVAYATAFSLVTGSMSIEESYALVILVQAALLLAMIAYVQAPTPARGLLLGLACAVPMSEYAALKPGILICPAVALGAAAWSTRRIADDAERRARWRRWLLSGAFFATAFLLLATPMLFEIGTGGFQFFEGRGSAFLGSDSAAVYASRWPRFGQSLAAHTRLLFVHGLDGGLNPNGMPLVDPVTTILALVGVVLLARHVVRRVRGQTSDRAASARAWRMALWLSWSAGATAFCALWNPDMVYESRLFVVVPLVFLLAGEVLAAARAVVRAPTYAAVLLALVAVLVGYNGRAYLAARDTLAFRMSFRAKTTELCRQLDRRDPANRYALLWDWTDGIYFGDTPFELWVADQVHTGYDAWPCTRQHAITALPAAVDAPARLTQSGSDGRAFTHVIVGARAQNNDDLTAPRGAERLDTRLGEHLRLLEPRVDPATCERFASSVWFRYAICALRPATEP